MKFFWLLDPERIQGRPGDSVIPQIKGLSITVWAMSGAILVFILWGAFAQLDEITRAQGSVIASSRTQVIQSFDGGTIEQILVREGDVVEAGQVLMRLEVTRMESSYLEAKARQAGLQATAARLQAEIFNRAPQFPATLNEFPEFKRNQMDLFRKRQSSFREEVSSLEAVLGLVQQELNMLKPLLETGDVSRTEVLRLQRQEADLQAQITNKRNRYFQDAQAELNKVEEDLAGIEQTVTQRKYQLENTILKAPVKGVVKNIRITTRGGVLRPGEEVMQIVPLEDDLIIEANLKPKDIGHVHPGMPVSVKVDAYDSSIYGTLPGELVYISADAFTDETRRTDERFYRVQVKTLSRTFSGRPDENLEIQPGMTATIEIKTGSRSVLTYIFKPITKTMGGALSER